MSNTSKHSLRESLSAGKDETDADSETLFLPRVLEGRLLGDRYHLLATIGSGGMGTVYEAVDIHDPNRELVAIKVLRRKLTKENLQRFRREATAASSVSHPHICQVHRLGVAQGLPFLVMEHLRGETLRTRIAREGPFSIADTVAIGVQLLDALSAAHAARVLHRDVKPGNVFITTPTGQTPLVKVIDFGLARMLPSDAGENTTITLVGVIPGTPAYLSPEQITGRRDLDEGVDIWAAALTLYEMLTAQHGFTADNFESLALRITASPCPSARALRRDVPPDVDEVLARGLAKRRGDRWESASAFRNALISAWARHRIDGLRRGSRLISGVPAGRVDHEDRWRERSASGNPGLRRPTSPARSYRKKM